ncbi:MAG: peptidase M22 [Ruminococcaceae bacterium]|nr:peptidase M22 [Oscillospiraceae bacterium]
MSEVFLGIDTSNYTTSVAVVDRDGNVLANLKKLLPVKEGERGLRQSDAVFHHTVQLPLLFEAAKEFTEGRKIVAVGVSMRPTDREGSYMPCFLAGASAAGGLCLGAECRQYGFSHQCGHIMAALYSSESQHLIGKPFAAFHVSGGTTDILLCTPGEGERPFTVERVGGTLDINAGQAIDRAGVYMGLKFPAGAFLERLAREYSGKPKREKICVKGLSCNLSGLENKASAMYDNGASREEVAAFVIDFIKRTLIRLTENLREEYKDIPIVYAGGVMSCGIIKEELSGFGSFALPAFSADNAAGTALLARKAYLKEI